MTALDCQRIRAQRRHPLHHSWLPEGVLSGFNHGHEIDYAARGKLRDKSTEESWKIIEDLALYDNKSTKDIRPMTP
ncbi:hypothetical protein Tco_0312588 [Tanacetum coccineum]